MKPPLGPTSQICAVIPHFECEEWLEGALSSLLDQSRPPDAIVVVDDASPRPPIDIVRTYPDVTLLAAADNGGPYRLVQAVIDSTAFDGYLFQDADDWSAIDRLEALLSTAAESGAELIGSHEVRVLVDEGDVLAVRYARDVNAALRANPTAFPLLHPTSLVGRSLVSRIGGFATGMRFSGDAEFLRRAAHVVRVVNADHFGYFRRKRSGSLTTDPATALESEARRDVQTTLAQRATANAQARERGKAPDLRPWRTAPPPVLRHVAGPPLDRRRAARSRSRARAAKPSARPPIFVVGAPRSGHSLMGWALGQHPALRLITDARWLARAATDIQLRATEEAAPTPDDFAPRLADTLRSLAGGGSWVAAGTELTGASGALAALFPDARFIHLVRDVDEVADALAKAPTEGGSFYTPEASYRTWLATAEAGADLEAALGPERVLRVRHRDLVAQPRRTLGAVLYFVGLPEDGACLRPLRGLETPREPSRACVDGTVVERARSLSERLLHEGQPPSTDRDSLDRLNARLVALGRGGAARLLVEKVRETVTRSIPDGAVVVVASRGDPRLVDLPSREGWHYPQTEDGTYAGHHPADSSTAVRHLEELRAAGGEYLVFPVSGMWWLSHYDGLREHLRRYPVVAYDENTCVVFRLSPAPAARSGDGKPRPAELVLGRVLDGRPHLEAVPK